MSEKEEENVKMEKEINDSLNWFYSRTFGGHVIKYLNGFVGVGILTIPSDHLTKGANEIWHYQIGSNTRGTGIEEIINVEMDIEEAEDSLKCFKICIEQYKKNDVILKEKKINEIEEEMDAEEREKEEFAKHEDYWDGLGHEIAKGQREGEPLEVVIINFFMSFRKEIIKQYDEMIKHIRFVLKYYT